MWQRIFEGFPYKGCPILTYVCRQREASKESFCWIEIPMSLWLCWESNHKYPSESFNSLLNTFIPGAGFAVHPDAVRVEERLRNKCCASHNTFRSWSGRKKRAFVSETFKMNVFVDEVLSLDDVKEVHNHCLQENYKWKKKLKNFAWRWKKNFKKGTPRKRNPWRKWKTKAVCKKTGEIQWSTRKEWERYIYLNKVVVFKALRLSKLMGCSSKLI